MPDTPTPESQELLLEKISQLEHDLAERLDAGSRLEQQAAELVEIAEDLDQTRTDLQKIVLQRDRFFSIIAHDLRSPFNALLGFTELLAAQSKTLSRDTIQEYAELAHHAGRQTHKLLENLLEWSRLQTGSITYNPKSFLLPNTVNDAVALFEASADAKDIRIIAKINIEGPVIGDPIMVDTILRNLIDNAVKFTAEGGEINVLVQQDGSRVKITVRDSGVGIPPESVARLFKLDSKVSTPGTKGEPSSGLGLQLCHELAALHGAPITVESVVGEGSAFSFSVALDDGA